MSEQKETPPSGRWMRLVGRAQFLDLAGASVDEVLARGGVPPERARLLRVRVLRAMVGRLGAASRRVRALTREEVRAELERERERLRDRRAVQERELAELESQIAHARGNGNGALTADEERSLQEALATDLESLLVAPDTRRAMQGLLERERVRRAAALGGALARERERIDVLERRIRKLRVAQDRVERALVELERRADEDGGLPSFRRSVRGLLEGDDQRFVKMRFLTWLWRENQELQRPGAGRDAPPSAGGSRLAA